MTGDAVGDLMFYGRGAGQMPTASAVWSDALEIARRVAHEHAALAEDFPLAGERRLPLRPMERRPLGLLPARHGAGPAGRALAGRRDPRPPRHLDRLRASRRAAPSGAVPVVMMTHEARERDMAAALAEIDRLGVVAVPTVMLRVEAQDGAP